jgi:hypothetical protein
MTHDTSAPPLSTAGGPAPGGSRSAWRVLAVVLSLVLVGFGALTVASLLARVTKHTSATFQGVTKVRVDIGFEALDVRGSATATDVSMKRSTSWSFGKPHTTARKSGSTLVITSSCSITVGRGCTGRVTLVVPDQLPLSLTTGDGSVALRSLHGAISATTADGSVLMRDLDGPLNVRTSDGHVDASGLSGRLTLRLSDGSLDARQLRSKVITAQSSDGSLRLGFLEAPSRVTLRTSDGSVNVVVPHDGTAYNVTTEVSDGHKTVSVPTDPQADRRISAHTSDGSITITTDG